MRQRVKFSPHAQPGAIDNPGRAPERAARHLSEVPRARRPRALLSFSDGARLVAPTTAVLPARGHLHLPWSEPWARSRGMREGTATTPDAARPGAGLPGGPRRLCPPPAPPRPTVAGGVDPQSPVPPQRSAHWQRRTHPIRGPGAQRPAAGPPAVRPRPCSSGRPWLRGASVSAGKANVARDSERRARARPWNGLLLVPSRLAHLSAGRTGPGSA